MKTPTAALAVKRNPLRLADARLARAVFAVVEPGLSKEVLAKRIGDAIRARHEMDALCVVTTGEAV